MSRSSRAGEKRPVTIKDVARRAGVCNKTISNVINSPEIVKPETRQRVLRAIQDLDYRPNAAARSLVTRRRHLIGLVLFDITNPTYPEITEVVINMAREAGFTVLVCSTGRDPADEDRYVDLLIEQQVDGVLIAVQRADSQTAEVLMQRGIKVVLLNRRCADVALPYVGLDNENGGYLATKHLLDLGHRRIAFIRGVEYSSTSQEREAGYLRALRESGISRDPDLIVCGDYSATTTLEKAKELLACEDRPSAIFAAADVMALAVMDAAVGMGLRIPEDVAIVGFDDLPLASNSVISLTSVHGGVSAMAEEATRILFELINHPADSSVGNQVQKILPVVLQIRRSSGGPIQSAYGMSGCASSHVLS